MKQNLLPPPPTRWLQMELREISLPRVMSLESEPVMAEDYKFQSEGGETGGVESVMLQWRRSRPNKHSAAVHASWIQSGHLCILPEPPHLVLWVSPWESRRAYSAIMWPGDALAGPSHSSEQRPTRESNGGGLVRLLGALRKKMMTCLDCGCRGTGLFIICGNKYLIAFSCHLNPTMEGGGVEGRIFLISTFLINK